MKQKNIKKSHSGNKSKNAYAKTNAQLVQSTVSVK